MRAPHLFVTGPRPGYCGECEGLPDDAIHLIAAAATPPPAPAPEPELEDLSVVAGEVVDPPVVELDDAGRPRVGGLFSTADGHVSDRRDYDWDAMRLAYVEGMKGPEGISWPTLTEVGARFDAHPSRVREKAAQQGWRAQRSQHQARLEAERQRVQAERLAKQAVDLDSNALKSAEFGLQLCIARLQEIGVAHQRARTNAGPGGATSGTIDAQEQQRLAQAVDLWHKIGLRAVGDPETHRIELSGPNGRPLEIAQELNRDNPDRLAGVLAVLAQAGVGDLFAGLAGDAGGAAAADRRADGPHPALEAGR